MEQYIPKSALVAEIESLRRTTFTNFDEGVNATVQTLLETLNSLEVKEVDFEKELDSIWFDNKFGDLFDNSAVDYTNVREICKYFFELGMQVSNKAQKGEEV